VSNLGKLAQLARTRRWGAVRSLAGRWLWSTSEAIAIVRPVEPPLPVPRAMIPISVRPLEPQDHAAFTDLAGAGPNDDDVLVRINAAHLLESGLRTCYVAVTESGEPCYMQYVVDASQNPLLEEVFGGLVPPIGEGEAVLEFAFTLEPYRARGIMPAVMGELAARARAAGVERLILYVPADNAVMRRFYERLGFEEFGVRRERIRLLRRRVELVLEAAAPPSRPGEQLD
jgi:ribosomal protein S18 acetylase RimI-like enzyme